MTENQDVPEYMDLKVLYALDAQWVKIDDMIKWCKINRTDDDEEVNIHEMLKALIRLKNQK